MREASNGPLQKNNAIFSRNENDALSWFAYAMPIPLPLIHTVVHTASTHQPHLGCGGTHWRQQSRLPDWLAWTLSHSRCAVAMRDTEHCRGRNRRSDSGMDSPATSCGRPPPSRLASLPKPPNAEPWLLLRGTRARHADAPWFSMYIVLRQSLSILPPFFTSL